MRKTVALLMIILSGAGFVLADEPSPPVLRPASPDVPVEVKSDDADYLPNVIKQHNESSSQDKKTEVSDEPDNSIDENAEEETVEDENEDEEEDGTVDTGVNNESDSIDSKKDDSKDADVLEEEFNPINNDSTKENIKNKNFVPVKNETAGSEEKPLKKEKVKKEKKSKPKYGKYQDVQNDPYIQEWETQLANPEADDGSQKQGEEPPKTYTQDDYEQAYRDMQVPTFSFVHGVDPDQYYDMKDTMWSPYPLLRLNSPLYFKTVTIEPGYYLLTPREYKGDWYILFKESGSVKYTIPVFNKSYTPATYYRDNLKEVDMSRSARWQVKFLNAWGKYIRKSKRKPAVQCNVELTDLDNNFLLIDLYYGAHKYSTIFRIEKF